MTYFTLRLFRKLLILTAMITAVVFMTFTDDAKAQGGACCSFCNPIWGFCATLSYPNDKYPTSWDCIVSNGGEECEVCNPTC